MTSRLGRWLSFIDSVEKRIARAPRVRRYGRLISAILRRAEAVNAGQAVQVIAKREGFNISGVGKALTMPLPKTVRACAWQRGRQTVSGIAASDG